MEKNNLITYNYSFNDLKPINFRTDKEMQVALEEVLFTTNDTEVDWKKRDASLKKIGGIILGNQGKSVAFVKFFNQKLFLNLTIQMADLRSSLMREACRIAVLAGKELGNSAEGGIEKMLTKYILFKLAGSANKVISEASGNCIFYLVKYVQCSKVIGRVCEQASSKGTMIKQRCAQSLFIIFSEYQNTVILKNQIPLEDSLKLLMKDANGDVRSWARRAFLKYKQRFPSQGGILFNVLEKNIQKQLLEEESSGEEFTYNFPEPSDCDTTNDMSGTSSLINTSKKVKSPMKERTDLTATSKTQKSPYHGNLSSAKHRKSGSSEVKPEPKVKNDQTQSNRLYKNPNAISSEETEKEMMTEANKKKILQNLNSKLNQLTLLTGGSVSTEITKEKFEAQLIRHISNIENTDVIKDKVFSFEFFYNNFTTFHQEIKTISEQTIKRLIDIHIENLTESDQSLLTIIMKNLVKFFFYIPRLFNEYDTNTITKLVLTHISSNSTSIQAMCNQLLEIIRKKVNNDFLFKAVFELLAEGDSDEEVCYGFLLQVFEKCGNLIKNDKYFKEILCIMCQGDVQCKNLGKFLDVIYRGYRDLFVKSFSTLEVDDKQKMLAILEFNHSFFLRELKTLSGDENLQTPNNKKIDEDVCYVLSQGALNKTKKQNEINVSTQGQAVIPKEVANAINTNNLTVFLEFISGNKMYIPQFLSLLTHSGFQQKINTILSFIYALISDPSYTNDLNSSMGLMIKQLSSAVILNSKNSAVVESVKEIFNLIPFKLEKTTFFSTISKYLNTGNNVVLLQIILISIKNFVINYKDQNLSILLPYFIDGVFNMLNHQSSDIRKHAVYCSVEIYLVLGFKFEPYLNELSSAHQNLIRLFIKKRTGN